MKSLSSKLNENKTYFDMRSGDGDQEPFKELMKSGLKKVSDYQTSDFGVASISFKAESNDGTVVDEVFYSFEDGEAAVEFAISLGMALAGDKSGIKEVEKFMDAALKYL